MVLEVGACKGTTYYLYRRETAILSKRTGFVPRKDLTKGSKAAAERRGQYFVTSTGDVLIQSDNGANGESTHERPRYVGGYTPARGSGR